MISDYQARLRRLCSNVENVVNDALFLVFRESCKYLQFCELEVGVAEYSCTHHAHRDALYYLQREVQNAKAGVDIKEGPLPPCYREACPVYALNRRGLPEDFGISGENERTNSKV